MCYWVLTVSGKVFARTTLQHAICNELIDTEMKWWIDKFDEELDKRWDDTNFVDDVEADFYIFGLYEADEAAHGDGSNTSSDEAYEDMMAEESPEHDDIDNVAYNKCIGSEVIMDVPGEGPRRQHSDVVLKTWME